MMYLVIGIWWDSWAIDSIWVDKIKAEERCKELNYTPSGRRRKNGFWYDVEEVKAGDL